MWDNSTTEGDGSPGLERGALSARQSPFDAEPASRQAVGPVGRAAATLSWAVPSSAKGLRFPTLHLNPSLENPLENLFLVGVSAASGSGGAGEGERPLQPPRRQGRRTPQASACSLRLRPSGVRALDLGATRRQRMPRRRVCAGAGLCLLPSWGGRVVPLGQYSGSFLELPVRRCERPPGSPRLREATPPKEPQKPCEILAAHARPFCHSWENDRHTQAPAESGNSLPASLARFFILSSSRVACLWRETRAPSSPLGCGPRPPVTCQQVWGGAPDRGSGDGQQGGGGD